MLRVLDNLSRITGAMLFAYLALLYSTIGYDLDPAIATDAGVLLGVQLACLAILWVIEWKKKEAEKQE